MSELYNEVKQLCDKAGTNISEVCAQLKISRSTIERWKDRTPLPLGIYFSVRNHLENLVAVKQTKVIQSGTISTQLVKTIPVEPSEKVKAQIYDIIERAEGFPQDQDISEIYQLVIAELSPSKIA